MADMKFSCPHCGQHISYGDAWAGIQTQCPACHNNIVVPQVKRSAASPVPAAPSAAPRLSAGVTQVPRASTPAPASARKFTAPPPRSDNSLLKYGLLFVVLAALGAAGYFYGLPLVTQALDKETNASPATSATAPASGSRGGPLGEVNEAMDASDALDGGSSPKARPRPATNNAARPQTAAPRR